MQSNLNFFFSIRKCADEVNKLRHTCVTVCIREMSFAARVGKF